MQAALFLGTPDREWGHGIRVLSNRVTANESDTISAICKKNHFDSSHLTIPKGTHFLHQPFPRLPNNRRD
jgi:hypothetical protein